MSIADTAMVVNQLLGNDHLKTCKLQVTTKDYSNADEVSAELLRFSKEFPQSQGWLCFESEVLAVMDGNIPDAGILRYGELGTALVSLHLRPGNLGGWRVFRFEEAAGTEMIVEEKKHLGRQLKKIKHQHENPGDLLYHRYWQNHEDQGFVLAAARFIGFVPGGQS